MNARITFVVLIGLVVLASGTDASAGSCWLQTSELNDAYVVVYDADPDGSKQRIVWRGVIPAGARQSITSDTGSIIVSGARDKSHALITEDPRACAGENTITVNYP